MAQFPSDHTYYFSKEEVHWEFAYIILAGPALPQLLERIRNRPVTLFNHPLDPQIQEKVLSMVDRYEGGMDDGWKCMSEAGDILSLLLKEEARSEDRISTSRRIPRDPDILEPIVKNPGLTIAKSGWAEEKGQSRFQLYRQVKAKTGVSPKDVRNQQRVKEAIRFLKRANLTMKDIAKPIFAVSLKSKRDLHPPNGDSSLEPKGNTYKNRIKGFSCMLFRCQGFGSSTSFSTSYRIQSGSHCDRALPLNFQFLFYG